MASEIESNSDPGEPTYDWLNEELFVPIFKKELNLDKSEFTLKLVSVKPAVGKGENYIAQVTRVQVEVNLKNAGSTKLYSFIIKSDLADIKEMSDWGAIEKELTFYAEVIPKLNKFDEHFKFAPRCFLVAPELNKSIILEDLSAAGYKVKQRFDGLDLEHCTAFFKKLGEYHALTAACFEKCGPFEKRFQVSRFGIHAKPLHTHVVNLFFPTFLEIFTKYDNLKPHYETVKKWEGKLCETISELTDIKPDEFNVLNHGDSWVNNLLYLYNDDNKPIDVSLIDHQLSMFGTPIFDILYFFMTSPNLEVRANHFDDVILVYHKNLVKCLQKYGYSKPIPTMRDLQMEILRKGPIACFMLVITLALVLISAHETGPFSVMFKDCDEGKQIRYNLYNNPRYIRTVEAGLKFMEKRGLLIE